MRIIINHIEMDDLDQVLGLLNDMPKQNTNECIYTFKSGAAYYVKKTQSGFSIFKEPNREAQV